MSTNDPNAPPPPDPHPTRDLSNAQAVQAWMPGGVSAMGEVTVQTNERNAKDVADRDTSGYLPVPFRAKLPKLRDVPRKIYRDPPISSLSSYTLDDVRAAVDQHVVGGFTGSGQLADKMTGDDRVASVLGSRVHGLLGLPFAISPRREGDAADEIATRTRRFWPRMAPKAELAQLLTWGVMMGFAAAEVIWTHARGWWVPTLRSWHPQLVYYRYDLRQYIAITMEGPVPIVPGDGKWVLFTPRGDYRGWMHGAVRTTSTPWAYRQVFLYHWARHAQKHGKPWVVADVPAAWSDQDKARMVAALADPGDEMTLTVPQVDPNNKFDVRLLEARYPAAAVFERGVYRMDTLISCAILGQNLTTEVQGGSYAAATVHGQIRQDFLESDAATLSECLRQQLLRPFCAYNFPDGMRAIPKLRWDATPPSDKKLTSTTIMDAGNACKAFAEAGFPVSVHGLARELGIPIIDGAKDKLEPPPKTIDPAGAGHPFGQHG